MNWKYSIAEFVSDLRYIQLAKKSWSVVPPIEKFIEERFNDRHGPSDYTTWRYSMFMHVNIYMARNREAFNFGAWGVAGPENSLFSEVLLGRVLQYAITHDVCNVSEFPEAAYFLEPTV